MISKIVYTLKASLMPLFEWAICRAIEWSYCVGDLYAICSLRSVAKLG